MKQKSLFSALFLWILFVLFNFCCTYAAETIIFYSEAGSLLNSFEKIPNENAGDVVILLDQSGTIEDNSERIFVPTERGVSSLTISTNTNSATLLGVEAIFANGIPLTLGKNVTLEDTALYGGGLAQSMEVCRFTTSELHVEGNVGFVFGGGLAEDGGHSIVEFPSVIQGSESLVLYEIFGGGHAFGTESKVESKKTDVTLSGTVDYALGAGYAEAGGESYCEEAFLSVERSGVILTGLFPGGSATDEGSFSQVNTSECTFNGKAQWIFTGDFAFAGGHTVTDTLSRLRMSKSAEADKGYLGGFASDPESISKVNTAELHSCGIIHEITDHGVASDGGKTETVHKGHFTCE